MNILKYSALTLGFSIMAMTDPSAAHADEGDIGYPSVTAAKQALLARDDIKMSTENGWLTVEDPVAMTLWTFTPESDPAHPAAIKRSVIQDGERIVIRMDIRCEGDETACDALENHFLSLNESVRDHAPASENAEPEADKDNDEKSDEGG